MDAKEQLEARRKSDRERFKRWKEKQAQAGKRHITAMISGEAYNIICQERDRTGNTTAEVIEQALLQKNLNRIELLTGIPSTHRLNGSSNWKPD